MTSLGSKVAVIRNGSQGGAGESWEQGWTGEPAPAEWSEAPWEPAADDRLESSQPTAEADGAGESPGEPAEAEHAAALTVVDGDKEDDEEDDDDDDEGDESEQQSQNGVDLSASEWSEDDESSDGPSLC